MKNRKPSIDPAPVWIFSLAQTSTGVMNMNSFKMIAVGNLAGNPELIANGERVYTRLCLVGNDYYGREEGGNACEIVTSIWFTAFGVLGEALAKNALRGDQLFLEARVQSNNRTDHEGPHHYDLDFVVTAFRFGARGAARHVVFDSRSEEKD